MSEEIKNNEHRKMSDEQKFRSAVLEGVIEDVQVKWDDIEGLESVKRTLQETIVYPLLRPDLFKGLRKVSKGVLFYGPPGTGRTMLAKALASEVKQIFFSLSASSLLSKWYGESEKMIRTLFEVAREKSPSIIFIDEIDSLLSSSTSEDDTTRRVKTEFLIQLDGIGVKGEIETEEAPGTDVRVLLIGATNHPQKLEDAALRRFSKHIEIPLPDEPARTGYLSRFLANEAINHIELHRLALFSQGYSLSDMQNMLQEAAMEPVREKIQQLDSLTEDRIRPIQVKDILHALSVTKPTVSSNTLFAIEQWKK